MTGEYPFELITDEGQMSVDIDLTKTEEIMFRTMPPKLAELLHNMLNPNPEERLSMHEVCNGQWFYEMEKLSYIQMKKQIVDEELQCKKLIERLSNLR